MQVRILQLKNPHQSPSEDSAGVQRRFLSKSPPIQINNEDLVIVKLERMILELTVKHGMPQPQIKPPMINL
jgi:hypothetical protein